MKTFPFPGHAMVLPEIVRTENCSLYDADGKRYVDLESGVWCTSVGHNNPDVNRVIRDQMDAVGHVGFCYSSPVVEEAADTVLRLLDHEGGRCTFLCSGSEAVEYGVRTTRFLLPDKSIMTMGDSYFGAYGDAAARKDDWFIFDWFECEGCEYHSCSDVCPRWASIPFNEIGAFLFEPGSSSGLVRFPSAQLVDEIAKTVQAGGGLVLINEVTTGVGRTGEWFGFQHYDVQPDIVAMGKGIGNGYPVSVTSMNERVVDLLGGKPIPYGQSHFNDPLGAAVVKAVIDHVEDNRLIQRAGRLSKVLLDGLNGIADESPHVTAVRGRGLMAVVELAGEDDSRADRLHRSLIESGFIVVRRPMSCVLRMDPALTIEEEDVLRFLDVFKGLLQAY